MAKFYELEDVKELQVPEIGVFTGQLLASPWADIPITLPSRVAGGVWGPVEQRMLNEVHLLAREIASLIRSGIIT